MSVFREFLYLNAKLVDEFLAQVEGGIFDDEREKATRSGDDSARVGIKSPIEASLSRGAATADEVERVRRQTPESRFNRLHSWMSDSDDLVVLDGSSGVLFKEIEPRSLVEIDVDVDIPQVSRFLGGGSEMSGVLDFMEAMKKFAPEQVDPSAEEAIKGLSAFSALAGDGVMATGAVDSGAMRFAFKLDKEWLRCDFGDLEGEATVVGRVLKKWSEGNRHSLLALPGLSVLNRQQRRQMADQATGDGSEESVMEGPAATLSVVAIFR